MPELAVIIPYYQRETGLLRRAVDLVLRQRGAPSYEVIVVDDGSPNDPAPELADLFCDRRCDLVLLRRTNGGAGAARNTGIEHAIGRARFIAFLDLDDLFGPEHLRRMWMAFSAGADFYFCDTNRPGSDRSAFAINGFPRGTIEPFSHDDRIFWYRNSLLRLNLTDAPFGTNCIGYRLAGQERIRFSTEFTRSCEDRFFIAELARHAQQTAFSVHRDVELGVGVNIFASSVWGTAAALVRMLDTARFHVRLGREFVLDRQEQQLNGRCLRACDKDFWQNVCVVTLKTGYLPIDTMRNYLKLRPGSFHRLPDSILGLARAKFQAWRKLDGRLADRL